MTKIGQNLKKIRLFLELNQIEFAKTIDITQGALSKIEKGVDRIDPNILQRVADKYNVSLDWLVLGRGDPPIFDDIDLNKKNEALAKQSSKGFAG